MVESYILGVNGWETRGHDASATLLRCSATGVDIVAAAEEERFTRKKHAYDTLPTEAIEFCLEHAGINAEDIDVVALSWDMPKRYSDRGLQFTIKDSELVRKLFGRTLMNTPEIEYVNHHLSHALSAFSPSGFDSSVIMIIDGQGEDESTSVWKADGSSISLLSSSNIGSSLGYFYEALSSFVGFHANEAGKTMGLAPYGNAMRFFEPLHKLINLDGLRISVPGSDVVLGQISSNYLQLDEQEQTRRFWMQQFEKVIGLSSNDSNTRYSFDNFPQPYLDLAASGQAVLEDVILGLARRVKAETGQENFSLAGGVALNCVANGRLVSDGLNVYVQPAASDAGTSLGAALEIARQQGYEISKLTFTPYLGREYSDSEVVLKLKGLGISFKEGNNMAMQLAELVAQGKVVGLCQGRFEFGPRALGNRSFVADPRKADLWGYINAHVKDREQGRPLAATILDTSAKHFFGYDAIGSTMTITYNLIEPLPAVTHIDGSTRPQIISQKHNPQYFDQILAVSKEIGVEAVINTSLNLQEPIVNSPAQALSLLNRAGVDAIIFNNQFIVYRGGK